MRIFFPCIEHWNRGICNWLRVKGKKLNKLSILTCIEEGWWNAVIQLFLESNYPRWQRAMPMSNRKRNPLQYLWDETRVLKGLQRGWWVGLCVWARGGTTTTREKRVLVLVIVARPMRTRDNVQLLADWPSICWPVSALGLSTTVRARQQARACTVTHANLRLAREIRYGRAFACSFGEWIDGGGGRGLVNARDKCSYRVREEWGQQRAC